MQLVTLDFETYYDKDFTLKKMTIEEYVRDSRFKVHCLGKKLDNEPSYVDDSDPEWVSQCAVLCHHAHFDGFILSHHYGIKPAFWFDTLSMARLVLPHLKSHSLESLAQYFGLGTKTVPYNLFIGKRDLEPYVQKELEEGCKHDADLTYEIFKQLLPLVSPEELRVIDLTIRMFTEPALHLDAQALTDYVAVLRAKKEKSLSDLGLTEKDLASSAKFADILIRLGAVPPTKISGTTGKEIYALAKTDTGFKDLLDHEDGTVQALAAARLGVKSTINETRADRLASIAKRGTAPVYLKYYGAHTGRWSGGDSLNWQNFPRGGVIRKAILAPPGYVLVVADLSQIECRMLNYLAGQDDVLEAFRNGRDLYCEAASRFYGKTITKADKEERQLFKQVELGCGYGMGAAKFKNYVRQSGIHVEESTAQELINFYRKTHPAVKQYWAGGEEVLKMLASYNCLSGDVAGIWGPIHIVNDKLVYPNGGFSIYHNLHKNADNEWYYTSRGREIKIYGSLLVENVVQALSRIVLSEAMLKIAKRYKIVMTTHDEVVYLARIEEAQEAYIFGIGVLTTPPVWCKDIPLAAEGGYAKEYSK